MIEKMIRRNTVFKGAMVNFRQDTVRLSNNRVATREFMDHPGAVGIVPVLKNGNIVLIKQFRYPVGVVTYEIPAGKLSKGENPPSCAKRELAEEANLKPLKIKKLINFWPTAAFSNEVIHLYVAEKVAPAEGKPDYDEILEKVDMPLTKALALIRSGTIKDSKTIIALSLYALQFHRRSLPLH
jgi:ADP-ribose pyrophosphatase